MQTTKIGQILHAQKFSVILKNGSPNPGQKTKPNKQEIKVSTSGLSSFRAKIEESEKLAKYLELA